MSEISTLKKRCLLFGISLLSFSGYLDGTIVSTALPAIQKSFNMPLSQLQWVMNAFFLGICTLMASMGRLGDIYGRRKVFYSGVCLYALSAVAAAYSPTALFLIICRALQGVATAITIPVGITLIQVSHKKEELPKAMSVFGSITGAGIAAGPVLGGALVSGFGWPAVFWVCVPIVLIGLVLCLCSLKESRSEKQMSLDYWGMIFLMLTIGSLVYGLVEANSAGWTSDKVIVSFVVTIVSLFTLIVIERTVQHPIIAGYLFQNRVFIPLIVYVFLGGSTMGVILFIDPLYLHIVLGKGDFALGAIMFIITCSVVLTAYIVGHVYHYLNAKTILIVAALSFFLVALLHMTLGVSSNYVVLVPAFILMGIGWGTNNTVPGIVLGHTMPRDHLGVAVGTLFSFYDIGAAVMLAVSVAIFHSSTATHLPVMRASELNAAHFGANTLLKSAFMSGMHSMYIPILLFAIITIFVLSRSKIRANR